MKTIKSALGGFIVMFLLSGLWHMIIAPKIYPPNKFMGDNPPNLVFIGAGYVVLAVLMAILYSKYQSKEKPMVKGLKFGVFIGALWSIPIALIFVGALNYPIMAAFLDSVWGLIEQGIGGIVIAWIYSTK